jgi:O-antigen/teichoic acid export membrane protein
MLGPEGIGRVNYAMSLMGYFLLVIQIGFIVYAIKETAKVRDDKKELGRVSSELFAVNAIMSSVSLAIYLIIIISVGKFRSDIVLFMIVGINIAANIFSIDWFYGGIEEYKYITMRNLVIKTIYIALIFVVIRTQADYLKYVLLGTGALVAGNIINMVYLLKKAELSFVNLKLKKHFKPIGMMLLVGVLASIYNKLDVVLLGYMTGPKYVGYYTTCRSITGIIISFVTALGTVLIPRLAYYLNNGMKNEYKNIAEKSLNFIYFSTFPIIAAVILLSDEILMLFGGGKFIEASISLKILSFQILANGLSVFLGYQVILANNDEKMLLKASVPAVFVNLAINLLLIKRYFHVAPSIAIVAAETVNVATQFIMARKYIKFRIFKAQSMDYLAASAVLFAVVYLIKKQLHLHFMLVLLICLSIYFFMYCFYLFIRKDDNINTILGLILKKGKSIFARR